MFRAIAEFTASNAIARTRDSAVFSMMGRRLRPTTATSTISIISTNATQISTAPALRRIRITPFKKKELST